MTGTKRARRCLLLLSACGLAAVSASAAAVIRCEVRVGGPSGVHGPALVAAPAGAVAGLSAGSLQAPGLRSGLSAPAAPVVAPAAGKSVRPAPAELPIPQAPVALSWSGAPGRAAPAAQAFSAPERGEVPAALSPERRAEYQSLSSELGAGPATISPEKARDLGARFFTAARLPAAPAKGGELGPGANAVSASLAPAGPAAARAPPQAAARRHSYRPQTGLRAALQDRLMHARLLGHHFYWYTVTHIAELWPSYQEKRAKLAARGEASAVTRPRTFFSYMRVMGETGVFYVLGFAALNDRAVLEESRRTFDRFFDGPGVGPETREAFERFLGRILVFNAAHRAHSNMKKHIRDALLLASVMPARDIAPFFDSLALKDKTDEIDAFQRQGAPEIIKAFAEAVRQTLAEEPDSPDRVLGVVLMGSFARGAATPTSDMDAEPLAVEGAEGRVAAFNERLVARWEALGLQKANPITPHEHPLHPSPGLLSLVHPNGDFLVFADDAALEEALAAGSGAAASPMVRDRTVRGWLGRALEFGTVFAVTCWTDLKRVLRAA
ncbi:MAG: nucleotidyltransferase domain-containing protein [Elusimicrobia bacterium]|nr:nucleotidyltransferase domain-containing protein [Elusimicrobiota bacterium]